MHVCESSLQNWLPWNYTKDNEQWFELGWKKQIVCLPFWFIWHKCQWALVILKYPSCVVVLHCCPLWTVLQWPGHSLLLPSLLGHACIVQMFAITRMGDNGIPNLNTTIRAQHKQKPTMRTVRMNGQITEVKQPRPRLILRLVTILDPYISSFSVCLFMIGRDIRQIMQICQILLFSWSFEKTHLS